MSDLRTAIEANYIDANGFVNPQSVLKTDIDKTGNGLLYTSLYDLQLKNQIPSESILDITFASILSKCLVKDAHGWPILGLFNRSPTKKDQESMDDYYGIAATNRLIAQSIKNYGISYSWNFNNVNYRKFTFESWFGRAPWFVAHIYNCANIKPNFLLRFSLALRLAIGAFGSNPNGRILDWLMVISIKNSWLCNKAVNFWWKGLYKKFPLGMKQVVGEYFGIEHPLAVYWKD